MGHLSAVCGPARISWSFAERCDAATAPGDVARLLFAEMKRLGFVHVACGSHVDAHAPPADAVMMINYPAAWIAHHSACGYPARDPVYATARTQALPFQWSDARFRAALDDDQTRILAEAADAGLGDGFTIPIHAPDARAASCSLVIGPDGVDPLRVREAHWFAVYAHETARRLLGGPARRPFLSRRERECLCFIAGGKTDYETGVILGISEHTVHNTVRRAMQKYGVATRVQAFVRALKDQEIRIEDIPA
jgi:LuxR family quorum-sensing system transcriptional regulator CciR